MPEETLNTTQDEAEFESLMARLRQSVLFVSLRVSFARLTHQIEGAVVEVDGQPIAAEMRGSPRWRLLPETFAKQLSQLEGRARKILAGSSVSFARQLAVLPIVRAPQVFEQLAECRREMDTYADQFAATYTTILSDLREKLGPELYEQAAKRLPSEARIRDKFGIQWAIIELESGRGVPISLVQASVGHLDSLLNQVTGNTREHLAEVVRQLRSGIEQAGASVRPDLGSVADQALIQDARRQMQRMIADTVSAMANEPRQELAAAIDNLLTLQESSTARTGTLDRVRRAFDNLQGFSFIADSELLSRMEQVKTLLAEAQPQHINSATVLGNHLGAALRSVREAAANEVAAATATRRFRGVRALPSPALPITGAA